jgi:nicotinamide-nucleotide adenylyltransferase
MIALYIGRFQPFHLGHLDAIKQILNECNKILIVIGSAQYSRTKNNPFSCNERKKMIEKIFIKENINYEIFYLDDIHDKDNWVNHVKKNIPYFDKVYSSNPLVRTLFNEKNIQVENIKFNINISAEKIRDLIITNNNSWKNYIHKDLIKFMENEGKEIILKSKEL